MRAQARKRPRIVHVSMDFPDPYRPRKTTAVRQLIELTADRFDHRVLSFNRVTPSALQFARVAAGSGVVPQSAGALQSGEAYTYAAPPWGLLHARCLTRLGEWIARALQRDPHGEPDLLVAHKLTVEGIAVAHAARLLGIPYALSLQGNTDTKILSVRPDLRPRLRKVWRDAAGIFPFTPWVLAEAQRVLGPASAPVWLLPCATELDAPLTPAPNRRQLLSVFHLDHWRVKNFAGLIAACERHARAGGGGLPLAVIGDGASPAAAAAKALARRSAAVTLEGALGRADLAHRMNQAAAMVLPSRRETFGMVFLEALFAGCPIIYPAGRAVDGYFDGAPFALRVDPRSVTAIADAMAAAVRDEASMKAALAVWQTSPAAKRFQRPGIAAQFAQGLTAAMEARDAR